MSATVQLLWSTVIRVYVETKRYIVLWDTLYIMYTSTQVLYIQRADKCVSLDRQEINFKKKNIFT